MKTRAQVYNIQNLEVKHKAFPQSMVIGVFGQLGQNVQNHVVRMEWDQGEEFVTVLNQEMEEIPVMVLVSLLAKEILRIAQ